VMPSLGHGTGLPYREGETPARAPINNEPLKPRMSNVYVWGLGENRGVHGKLALRLLRHKTKNTGAHKIIETIRKTQFPGFPGSVSRDGQGGVSDASFDGMELPPRDLQYNKETNEKA